MVMSFFRRPDDSGIDHIEAPGAAPPPRYIRNSAHRAIGPHPVTNASLENWHGTLVHQSDHQRTLAGFSTRLSPEVMRTHTRQRASELARHGSSSAHFLEESRRRRKSDMEKEIARLSIAARRVRDLERLRAENHEMADSVTALQKGSNRLHGSLKQINLRQEYFQVFAWKDPCHAVHTRAGQLHNEYARKLHDADRAAGTQCPHRRTANGSCARSDNNLPHSVGGGEQHLRDKFGIVQALVFGHFGEFNDGLIKLASDISRSIAHQHHRALGFKSVKGGLSRAKAGVMRRLSMVALRCSAAPSPARASLC